MREKNAEFVLFSVKKAINIVLGNFCRKKNYEEDVEIYSGKEVAKIIGKVEEHMKNKNEIINIPVDLEKTLKQEIEERKRLIEINALKKKEAKHTNEINTNIVDQRKKSRENLQGSNEKNPKKTRPPSDSQAEHFIKSQEFEINRNKDDKKKSYDNSMIAKKIYSEVEESKNIFTNYFALFERRVIYKEMKRVIKKFHHSLPRLFI